MIKDKVRVRMAPTPSGFLHLGTAHTALFNWLFARHYGGKFILRIDDTDPKRYRKEYEEEILESLRWLGINWDEGPDIGGPFAPYRQSKRMATYWRYIKKLLDEGKAYRCYCSPEKLKSEREAALKKGIAPKYSGCCRYLTSEERREIEKKGRRGAVRLKVSPGPVSFIDPSRGKITVKAEDIGDFVIARSDNTALLATATTIDDIEMKITHTIRGEDYLNFVPKQILLYDALGKKAPVFAHLSFIYGPDGSKLSKRHGSTAVSDYRKNGYLSDALVNYLMLLGWSPKDDREILSLSQVVKLFKLEDVSDANPKFDLDKLTWLNGAYIRRKTDRELGKLLKPFTPKEIPSALLKKMVPLVKERIKKLTDFPELVSFLIKYQKPNKEDLVPKGKSSQETLAILSLIFGEMKKFSLKNWQANRMEKKLLQVADSTDWKRVSFFQTFRVAIAGGKTSPPLFGSIELLGKKETLNRLRKAMRFL
ncbi:MAG: glutamate--tRNA ligase [Candidatus Pacebacteria bacterium]|nr:glutamate--tRNA ligase [Candidatus Paceibacterota bacterium]